MSSPAPPVPPAPPAPESVPATEPSGERLPRGATEEARIVVIGARGTEALIVTELEQLGASRVVAGRAQVSCTADYSTALRICLWSRVASRVLWPVCELEVADPDQLYVALKDVPIEAHLESGKTFSIDCTLGEETGAGTPFSHSQFITLRAKDAIVDRLREQRGARPDVDRERPDLRIHVHIQSGRASISIDLSGEALHRRGYRGDGRAAPLKENLAAALLLQMGWPDRAARDEPLCDPMCGSGTILIEAAMMLGDRAPGLLRQRWGFSGWAQHDEAAWAPLLAEARERAKLGLRVLDKEVRLFGCDSDGEAILAAQQNAKVAGLEGRISLRTGDLDGLTAPVDRPGLLLTNPPYGERLGEEADLPGLYARMGDVLKRSFPGWTAGIFTAQGPLTKAIGLRPTQRAVFWNGPIECRLLTIPISTNKVLSTDGPGWRKASTASEMFANRVIKNLRHLGKWARREDVSCYRIYDADLHEYAVAVDLYEGWPEGELPGEKLRYAHVQEYAAPDTIDPGKAERRLNDVLARLPEVLKTEPDRIVLKVRRRQKHGQYEAQGRRGERIVVEEGGHRFIVNLHDYLDTGLFIDQRALRQRVGAACKNKSFLNLFCYTASASVYAARAGARSTTSVDLSNTYLSWAEDNYALNELDPRHHRLVQDDCLHWLSAASAAGARYDVILLAPPTFSNSKRMEGVLDLQEDHTSMIASCAGLLEPGGELYFVNHFRRFKMQAPEGLVVEELTHQTLPDDFSRDARFHNAWRITRA